MSAVKKDTQYSDCVLNERDPILREIWAEGYTHVEEDTVNGNIKLLDTSNNNMKVIDLHYFRSLTVSLNFKRGLLPDGTTHTWVSEADGSAERLREMIRFVN